MAKLKDKTKIALWISKEDKERAEEIIHSLGLTSSEVVRLLYKQIIFQRKLPFDISLQNYYSCGPIGNDSSFSVKKVSETMVSLPEIKPNQIIKITREKTNE